MQSEIAHVKAQVTAGQAVYKASITQSGTPVSWDLRGGEDAADEVSRIEFILNARVETSPQVLEEMVRGVMAELCPAPRFRYEFADFSCISPGAPRPTERIVL